MPNVTRRRYQVIGTAWSAWFVNYIDRTKTSVLLPLIAATLSMNTQQTGWVLFAFFIGYAAVQPFAGFITDLVGAKKALAISIAAFSIFTWTMALVGNWQELLLRNALFGIAQGFEVTAGSRLAATWFPAETRGRAFAFHQTAFTIAPIITPFIVIPLAQATGSWRWSFMLVAFLGLPVIAAIDHFIVDRPERDPRISQGELNLIFGEEEAAKKKGKTLDPARAHASSELPPGERPVPYREIFLNRSVILMFFAGFFGLLASWGLTSWLPTYGVQQLKLPLLLAGTLTSIVYLGTLFGVLAGGYISDKWFGTKRTPVWLIGGIIMAASLLLAATLQRGTPIFLVYTVLFIAGFSGSMIPGNQLYAPYLAELLTPGAVGRSLGVVVLGAMVGSAIAQPLTAALILQTPQGPQFWPAFVMFAACGVLTTICITGMVEPSVRRTYLGYLFSGRKEGTWQPASPLVSES